MMDIVIFLAILIVCVLAGYAVWLHYRLWKLRTRKPESTHPVAMFDPSNRGVGIEKSLFLIADAFLDDKMTATEACLRICALANHLPDAETFRTEHGVLFHVAASTSHIPILDGWQALPREKQKVLNKERQAIELKYVQAVTESATRIKRQFS